MAQARMIAERYEVLAELGRGGMGLVARAFDHRLQTEVALKILRRDLTMDAAQTDSLVKEARVLARLTHPSVVRLFDLAETELGLMLILEYVRGPNLAQVLKLRGKLTETELLFIMRQICSGLDAAHAEGIIHRDLKPPNLLVATDSDSWESFKKGICTSSFLLDAKVKITDFGISKLLASRAEANAGVAGSEGTWSSAGTPLFMSPEQFRGDPSTPETDIYALGVVAYQAISGGMPFSGESVEALAQKHQNEAPKPIAGCPPHINQAILRAMAKRPEDRFASAHAFLAALEGSDKPVTLPELEPDALDKGEMWVKSHMLALSFGCLGLLVMAAIAVVLLSHSGSRPNLSANNQAPANVALDYGKRITLPEDMDMVPEIRSLPAPAPAVPPVPPQRGPRYSHIAWTALVDTEAEPEPSVDGVGPDGTVYVRERQFNTLWAIRDGALRWGYRASKLPLTGGIDWQSHADFRDPGRVWFAYCPDDIYHRRTNCSGSVFNASGAGGHIGHVPAGIGQPAVAAGTTLPFRELDAQSWQWPENNPRLFCSSRLNEVTLNDSNHHWSLPLDGRATLAATLGNGFLVSTAHGAMYALDQDGHVQWTYKAADEPRSLQVMPSGDVVILDKGGEKLTCLRAGRQRWTYAGTEQISEFRGSISDSSHLGVADVESALYFLTSGGTTTTVAIDRDGQVLWKLPWGGYVQDPALRLDERGRLFFTFWRYEVDHHSRGGVICIADK